MNRLIKEEIIGDQERLVKSYKYDLLGNRISSTDIFGNETLFAYDEFGRVVQIVYPNGAVIHKKYDALGNVTEFQDGLGHCTKAAYTVRGKPYFIKYPDGTEERFEYTLKGELEKAIHRNGSYSLYEYDYLSRPTKKETYSPQGELISSGTRKYGAFHLEEETDAEGMKTTYCRNVAGLLTSMRKGDQRTDYEYDVLGRQAEIREYYNETEYTLTSRKFDFLDRLISETVKDSQGAVISKVEYAYDAAGNRISTITNGSKQENRFITGINGIRSDRQRAHEIASGLSALAGSHEVHFVHNPTHGTRLDAYRYFLCRDYSYMTNSSRQLCSLWREGFSRLSSDGYIFHYCFSEGVTMTRNALRAMPPELRNRIIVVAVCPSFYIDKDLCWNIVHFCCERDFVHMLDRKGRKMAKQQGTIVGLKRDKPSIRDFWRNHDPLGPLVEKPLNNRLEEYLKGIY